MFFNFILWTFMECLHLLQHGIWKCMCFAKTPKWGKNIICGSFHAKWTTGCQVTPSDFTHIYTICSSIGRMNTQKKSVANSLWFWKYSSSKIWPDPPIFASAHRVIDLSDLWPAFIPVCNKIQRSKLLPGVISSHILRIWRQKHCILLSFYARGT